MMKCFLKPGKVDKHYKLNKKDKASDVKLLKSEAFLNKNEVGAYL